MCPSATTLLGLVKHAVVGHGWFDVALAGRSRAELGLPDTAEESFMLTADDTVDSVSELYRQAWSGAVLIAAEWALDDLALHNHRGTVPFAGSTCT